MSIPVLWSFRRCPYAMRARLAIASSDIEVVLREIVLRNKPKAFLATSPSATVPCLQVDDQVIDESFDIMLWALKQNDPEGWLAMPDEGMALISDCDGAFKTALDRYKYSVRYDNVDAQSEREKAAQFVRILNDRLLQSNYLMDAKPTLADMAILPFVRQYAHVDLDWFSAQSWASAKEWLEKFKTSQRFTGIMRKYTPWQPDQAPVSFPGARQ
ncbi:glutathione S-transferase [Roseovarius sp. EL26]|uniref:glutathione S-transferase n=1 Tax=Roseovarius sp. EL26 TaxID=2126672 RepID=UPI000EA34B6E|nr:glutathione S-transferase [Roseovarius sp. EL26]